MATYKTSGIVIGRHNFGEADRVVVLLTPERGVVRAVAKGVRRIKSRMAGHLELFSESELMLAQGRNMDVITSARLVRHLSIDGDYPRMRLAYLVGEMVHRLGGDGDHPGLFELVQDTFVMMGLGESGDLLELWFKIRLLDRLGYRPELGSCMVCGTDDPGLEYFFNVELGGIVDRACATTTSQVMPQEQIKFWRVLLDHPLDVAQRVGDAKDLAGDSLPVCDSFYDHTFGKRFRSAGVLD